MKTIETVEQMRHDSEKEALAYIEQVTKEARNSDFTIKKSGCARRQKVHKGIVILECWITTITKSYGPIWTDEEIEGAKEI